MSWTTPVQISDNLSSSTAVTPVQIIRDDDGLFHVVWRPAAAGSHKAYARTLNVATGALGLVKDMTPSYDTFRAGPAVEWDNTIAIVFCHKDASVFPPQGKVAVAYGSPTDDPVWTEELIHTDSEVVTDTWTVINGTDLYAWWITASRIQYASKSPGGLWSSATTAYEWFGKTFYEDDGQTFISWPGSNFLHNGSVILILDRWEIILGAFIDGYSTAFYLPPSSPPGGIGGPLHNDADWHLVRPGCVVCCEGCTIVF